MKSSASEKKTTITISRRKPSKYCFADPFRKKAKKAEAEEGKVTAEQTESEYKNLYKHFGPDHKNKDLRIQMQKKLNADLTSKMGPTMQLNINPSFQIDQRMDVTHFRETFKGERAEECDKVYFRRKDEISEFAECLCKSKALMTKK